MKRTLTLAVLLLGAPLVGVGSADTPEVQVDGPFGEVCVHADGDAECDGTAVSATGDAECEEANRPFGFLRCEAVTATGNASCPGQECLAASGTGDARGAIAVTGTGDAACSQFQCVAVTGTGNATCDRVACVAASGTGSASCDGERLGCVAATGTGEARCEAGIRCVTIQPRTDCVEHPPIEITEREGSEGFVHELHDGTTAPRPGSGVVAGNGTAENPYVIAGWCLIVSDVQTDPVDAALQIRDTDAHVVVRDNVIGTPVPGGQPRDPGPGVELDGANNVTVANNTIQRTEPGLLAHEVRNLDVVHNHITRNLRGHGAVVASSTDVRVQANLVEDNRHGLHVLDTPEVAVVENTVVANRGEGLNLTHTAQPLVEANTIADNGQGLSLHRATGATLEANSFQQDGLRVTGPAASHYDHDVDRSNTVNGDPLVYVAGEDGTQVAGPAGQVLVAHASQVTVQGVEIPNTDVAVQAASADVTLDGLTLTGNDRAIEVRGGHADVQATTIEDSREAGIAVAASGDVDLAGTTVRNTTGPGLIVQEGAAASASQTRVVTAAAGIVGLEDSVVRLDDVSVNRTTQRLLGWDLPREAEQVGVYLGGARLDAEGVWIADNPVAGVVAETGAQLTIEASTIEANALDSGDGEAGILLKGAGPSRIADSRIQDNREGLDARDTADLEVTHNLIEGSQGPALGAGNTPNLDVTENEIRDNGQGVGVFGNPDAEVRLNNIHGNGLGVDGTDGLADATDNWWGCPFGPDHPDCDDAIGVDFTPWRSEPVPDAGPR